MAVSKTPPCCEYHGLHWPDGRRRCREHASPEDRKLLTELGRRAPASGIKREENWPYGPNIDVRSRQRLLDWAEPRRLHLSKSRGCVGWLRTNHRCGPPQQCSWAPATFGYWIDHVTAWNRDGRPAVLLAQPYNLYGDGLRDLPALESEGFTVIVSTGWYGHGSISIEIWNKDQNPW